MSCYKVENEPKIWIESQTYVVVEISLMTDDHGHLNRWFNDSALKDIKIPRNMLTEFEFNPTVSKIQEIFNALFLHQLTKFDEYVQNWPWTLEFQIKLTANPINHHASPWNWMIFDVTAQLINTCTFKSNDHMLNVKLEV